MLNCYHFAVAGIGERRQLGHGNMENLTLLSVHACYGLAACLFVVAAAWRNASQKDLSEDAPFGRVSVAIYRPLDLIGFSIIVLLFYLLAAGNAGIKDPKITLSTILGSIGMQVFIVGIVVMMISRRANLVDWLGLKWVKWPQVFWIAPATVVSMWIVFSLLFSLGYMDLMERLGVEKVQDAVAMFQKENDPVVLGWMAFAAVIVAPICEEIVFRGYFYPIAKRFAGPWISALFAALIFTAAHGSMSVLLPLFIFGIVLARIYEATGSLWAPISIHCLFNGATVLIQLLMRYFEIPEDFGS